MEMTPTSVTGAVRRINPDSMLKSPAFTQVIEVSGPARTIYVGGQDAVDRSGAVVGKDDIVKQAEQVVMNLSAALRGAGAGLEDLVKLTIYVVQGQPIQPAYEAWLRMWGDRTGPPTVSVVYVAALGRPEYLLEIDAVAVVPLSGT
jgi:enamine deaminase RidA (YjgF/YER057c/UK114 family)